MAVILQAASSYFIAICNVIYKKRIYFPDIWLEAFVSTAKTITRSERNMRMHHEENTEKSSMEEKYLILC
jgi:hypothetical protein